jgi:hypothetical protein
LRKLKAQKFSWHIIVGGTLFPFNQPSRTEGARWMSSETAQETQSGAGYSKLKPKRGWYLGFFGCPPLGQDITNEQTISRYLSVLVTRRHCTIADGEMVTTIGRKYNPDA